MCAFLKKMEYVTLHSKQRFLNASTLTSWRLDNSTCMRCSPVVTLLRNWWQSSSMQLRNTAIYRYPLLPSIQEQRSDNASPTALPIHDHCCGQDSRESNDKRCKSRRVNIICGWNCRSDTGGSFRYSLAHFQNSFYQNFDSLCQMMMPCWGNRSE